MVITHALIDGDGYMFSTVLRPPRPFDPSLLSVGRRCALVLVCSGGGEGGGGVDCCRRRHSVDWGLDTWFSFT